MCLLTFIASAHIRSHGMWGMSQYIQYIARNMHTVLLCFALLCFALLYEVFIHIHQGCFAGTGAIVRLPQCQWSKPDGYGKISQCITTTKHSKAKTVCIFLGIYCRCHLTNTGILITNMRRTHERFILILRIHISWKTIWVKRNPDFFVANVPSGHVCPSIVETVLPQTYPSSPTSLPSS